MGQHDDDGGHASEGVDIDLYADDIEQDFTTDDVIDLYDDVIAAVNTGANDWDSLSPDDDGHGHRSSPGGGGPFANNSASPEGVPPLGKHQVYVGGLSWWTSDQTMKDTLYEMGVIDFVDVTFFENRANGQSKGYCLLTVGSAASLRLIHDKLPQKEINGKKPIVTPPSKLALHQFELKAQIALSKTRTGQGHSFHITDNGGPPMGRPMGPEGPQIGPGSRPLNGDSYGCPRMMNMGMGGPGPIRCGPRGMPPRYMGHPYQGPPMGGRGPMDMPYQGPRRPQMEPYFQGPWMGHGHGHGPMPPRSGPIQGPGPCPREWNRAPMNSYPGHGPRPMPPMGPNFRGPPPPVVQGQGRPSVPHINPTFFNQGSGPQGPSPPGTGSPGHYSPQNEHREQLRPISESEFEEVMGLNRKLATSAISRAVQEAAGGEIGSAVETLVTAISLIKQSRVGEDDRCKVLVRSLQDTLHGIETKSYSSRRGDDRSRSRERDRQRRCSRSRGQRTRSRSRDYRDRSRDRSRSRDRYYEYRRERSRSRGREDGRGREESRYYEERGRHSRERANDRHVDMGPERSRERERDPEGHRSTRH